MVDYNKFKAKYNTLLESVATEAAGHDAEAMTLPLVHKVFSSIQDDLISFSEEHGFDEEQTQKFIEQFAKNLIQEIKEFAFGNFSTESVDESSYDADESYKKNQKVFNSIAKKYLMIDTLETQGSDSSDFHNLSVSNIRKALAAAFETGHDTGFDSGYNLAAKERSKG
jgi:hypothetical protein